MQTGTVKVIVDVVAEPVKESVGEALSEVSAEARVELVSWRVLKMVGPAAGWPEVEVEFGSRESAKAWLTVFHGGDEEQAEYMMS